ncbi:MAG TPA: hypothetical protein VHD90_16170 [Phototrophicaceae bacterium]|nr:hypothetical protein [Phototrophicaceae bacterium]
MIDPNLDDDEPDQDERHKRYPDEYDYPGEDDYDDAPRPLWTRNRVLLIIVVVIMIVTLLAYMLQGLFLPPPPPPPPLAPGSLI